MKLFMAVIAAIGWFALGLQLFIMLDNVPGNGLTSTEAVLNFFSYFTILTNLLVAISLTASWLLPDSRMGRFFLKPATQTAVAVYIITVGIVYSMALRKIWNPVGLQLIADRLLHDVIPVLYLLFWLLFVPQKTVTWKNAFPWLAYPMIYLVFALTRGASTGWFAYYFLDFYALGWRKVMINIAVITWGFFVIALIMIAFKRWGKRKPES